MKVAPNLRPPLRPMLDVRQITDNPEMVSRVNPHARRAICVSLLRFLFGITGLSPLGNLRLGRCHHDQSVCAALDLDRRQV